MMKRAFVVLTLICSFSRILLSFVAASSDAGTDSALYLGAGAKSMAMGNAGLVNLNYADAMIWNPANLAFAPFLSASLQHAILFGDTSHETVAVNYPTLDWGTLGLSIQRMETGEIDRRNSLNLAAGSFGFMEQEASIAYGYPIMPILSVGMSVKLHHIRLDGLESMAPGVDLGILFNYPGHNSMPETSSMFKSVQVGAGCRNALTPVLKLANHNDRLFTNWRVGSGVSLGFLPELSDRFQFNLDFEKPEQANPRWHAGFDYQVYNMVAIRGGWDHEYISAGVGFIYDSYALDYAISFPEIGLRHLITFTASLGRNIGDLRAQRAADKERRRQAIIDKLKNKMINGYRKQAKVLTEKGDYAAAVPLWEKVLNWEPDNKDVQERLKLARDAVMRKQNSKSLQLAQQYYQEQRYIDTMVECRTVLERDPDNIYAKKLYSRAEKRAQNLGQDAIVTNVKMVHAIRQSYQKGLEAYTARDWSAAIKHWETVIENTPLQKQVYRYLQFARTRLDTATAAKAKKSTISKKESQKRKLYKEAVNHAKSGKLKDSMKTWEKLVKENPKDADAKKNLDETKKNLIESQKKGIRW